MPETAFSQVIDQGQSGPRRLATPCRRMPLPTSLHFVVTRRGTSVYGLLPVCKAFIVDDRNRLLPYIRPVCRGLFLPLALMIVRLYRPHRPIGFFSPRKCQVFGIPGCPVCHRLMIAFATVRKRLLLIALFEPMPAWTGNAHPAPRSPRPCGSVYWPTPPWLY